MSVLSVRIDWKKRLYWQRYGCS